MGSSEKSIWQERADYVDTLLHLKHSTFEKKKELSTKAVVEEIGVKRALINSIRRRVSNPKIYYNPFIQMLFRIKNKRGIKFN